MPDVGEIAGIIALVACPIYVHDILRGVTRPNRATWWIITLVGCLIAASYWESELDRLSCLGAAISVGTVSRVVRRTVTTPGNVGQDGFFSFFSKIKFAVPPWLSSMYPLHRRVL
jgi:hypothetical protein